MSVSGAAHLGDVAGFVRGITFKPDDVVPVGTPGSVACMRTKNVQAELDLADVWGISESFVKRDDQYLIPGDVLVSSANSWNLVGKCCWVPDLPGRSTFGGFISVLRSDPERVDPRYLFHWFASDRIQTTVRSFGQRTTNISNLNVDRCLRLPIPLPPLPKQRRIAEILDRAETLLAKRRAALAKLDILIQSIFLDMFGDPVTNPKRWAQKCAGSIGAVTTGNTPPRDDLRNYGDAIEWIKSDNLNTSDYYATRASEGLSEAGMARARIVPAEAILVTCIAGSPSSIGNAAMVNRPVAFNQQINAFVPEVGNPHFFFAQLAVGKRLVQQASTGGMKGLVSKGRFEKILLIVPPPDLQDRFSELALRIEGIKSDHHASLAQTEALFVSLQYHAFRGEL